MLLRKISCILFLSLMIALFSSPAFCQIEDSSFLHPAWGFETTEGWKAGSGITKLEAKEGKLRLKSSGFSYITSPELFFDTGINGMIKIRMRSDVPYSDAAIFWVGKTDKTFDIRKNIPFSIRKDNKFHTYYISMRKSPFWRGKVIQLIFSPSQDEGNFEIDYIRVERASLFGRLISGLQEFFSFETIKMRTVNIIMGQTLGGKHINFWAYLICFAIFLIVSAKNILFRWKSEDTFSTLKKALSTTIIVALVLWIGLEARILMDQARVMSIDKKDYAGKALEEKRSQSILGDFYDFIRFFKERLPKGSLVSVIFPSVYFREMGAYQGYPIRFTEKEGQEYLLVYYPNETQRKRINELKEYAPFLKFKDNQYIFKLKEKF